MAHLYFTEVNWYDLAKWTSEPVQLGEPVRTHIIQIFIYKEVSYLAKWSEGTVWEWTNFSYIILI